MPSTGLQRYDWILMIAVFLLTLIGVTAIYSVDLSQGETLPFFSTQILSFCIGVIVLFVSARVHMVFYESIARPFFFFTILALVLVLFFGVTIRGTTGWFRFAGFSFQPAELAKVAIILVEAWLIQRYGRRFDRWQFPIATSLAPLICIGLILLQPDLGTSLLLGGLWIGLLFLTGVKKRFLAIIFGMLGIGFLIGWFFLFAPYQKERLATFLDPSKDPLGAGYNVAQSIIAIGAGGLTGRGLGFGSQSQLRFLPEAQTDFIFSVIGEELGFIAVIIVCVLYALLLFRLLTIAKNSSDDFAAFTALGITLIFFLHVMVNIGAAAGLLPVTGVTLPFLSYGGSSLIINFLLIGIAESIAKSSRTEA